MNWALWRPIPWIDTRARFVAATPKGGSLLDLGSSDGSTLRHIAELRPDLHIAAADIAGSPEAYPARTDFAKVDFDADRLPWPNASFDSVTCMHVVEHLKRPAHIVREAARVLKPGGRLYIETPHVKSVDVSSAPDPALGVTMNFYDDATHVRPVPVAELAQLAGNAGLRVVASGTSRNLIFSAVYPILHVLRVHSRQRYVAQLHWTGWSVFLVASLPTT